ncbi:PucR family transcriptional regulator [Amycolatopsis suaedae]|uniref:PucR family transcriptional regulator n=1 Tax=Amycolatopsis suaedae TaxID=2510978 RepID=A0A4Q7JCY6_9PSEU|nr:helix-turn-helix domain-containing protein [Amycolatopsis suaedae]RZQ65770.1 PucR family transcriptional regulator [Amycolatopsis suaedae]
MTVGQWSDRVGRILREMAADQGVLDEVVATARAAAPEVARLPEAENRRHIAVLLAAGLALFDEAAEPDDSGFAAAASLGADRAAQGVPITALLRGVQAGRSRAVEIAIARGRAAGVPEQVLVETLLDVDRHIGELERQVITGYHTAELELSRTARDARTQLLRRAVLGRRPSDEELTQAGICPDGPQHCLVSDVSDPVQARTLEHELGEGVFGLVDGRLTGLLPRLPAPGAGGTALTVVTPAVPLDEIPALYSLCVTALGTAKRRRARGRHLLTELAGEVALAAQPALGALLGTTLLGALDPADRFHRQLAFTALAYLDNDRRLDHTAAALHVHPNTVRYRLDRLREITGLSVEAGAPGDQPGVLRGLRMWWGLRSWLDQPEV